MSRRFKSAYYSRAGSYSRSYNAEVAESEGRYPRTRAAKALGLSTALFDAACEYSGIHTSEWHHVGKYANAVDYWDTNLCAASPAFWMGAARGSKTKAKRSEFVAKARAAQDDVQACADYECGFRPTGRTPKAILASARRRKIAIMKSKIEWIKLWGTPIDGNPFIETHKLTTWLNQNTP